ncbi:hypothetical protein BJ912DRAFT_996144 [Pholiota molesta]|nr:hypothetical protein BJ912DRAFT_996144 [Pholiota molesta]
MTWSESIAPLSVKVIEALLGFRVGTVLLDMHALVFVPRNRGSELQIYHASLYDFFTDRSRSGDCYIDERLAHITLSRRWLEVMAKYPHIPAPFSLDDCVKGFVHHYNELSTGSSEIEVDLASFSLKKLLDEIRGYKDLHRTAWHDFLDCIEKNAGTRADVFPRLRNEFDAFVFERLSRYPQALQAFIPTIIVHTDDKILPSSSACIFHISLYDMYPSKAEHAQSRGHNSTLLDIFCSGLCDWREFRGYGRIFVTLFSDRSRAGQFFVDGRSCLALAKKVNQIIYPVPRTGEYRVKFFRGLHNNNHHLDGCGPDESHPTKHIALDYLASSWFENIIRVASEDLELAVRLRERALQYDARKFDYEFWLVADSSLLYIQRCGIPYKKHIHPAHTTRCIICQGDYPISNIEMSGSPRISIQDRLAFLLSMWRRS